MAAFPVGSDLMVRVSDVPATTNVTVSGFDDDVMVLPLMVMGITCGALPGELMVNVVAVNVNVSHAVVQ